MLQKDVDLTIDLFLKEWHRGDCVCNNVWWKLEMTKKAIREKNLNGWPGQLTEIIQNSIQSHIMVNLGAKLKHIISAELKHLFDILWNKHNYMHRFDIMLLKCMQVKIVTCFVDCISVDVSFNQMARCCSLCFLEQVNLSSLTSKLVKFTFVCLSITIKWIYIFFRKV